MLSLDTPYEVHLLILYFDLKGIHHLSCLVCNHHIASLISQISNQFLCDIFKHNVLLHKSKYTTFQKLQYPTQ